MTDNEFREKMKEFGWDNEYIEEIIADHNGAKAEGINTPYDVYLFEAPLEGYPTQKENAYGKR
jgi:hypothetical protein